jgi:hypothetical protein
VIVRAVLLQIATFGCRIKYDPYRHHLVTAVWYIFCLRSAHDMCEHPKKYIYQGKTQNANSLFYTTELNLINCNIRSKTAREKPRSKTIRSDRYVYAMVQSCPSPSCRKPPPVRLVHIVMCKFRALQNLMIDPASSSRHVIL